MFSVFSSCTEEDKAEDTAKKESDHSLGETNISKLQSVHGKDSLLMLMSQFAYGVEQGMDTAGKAHYYSVLGVLLYKHSELHLSDSVFGLAHALYGKMNDSANVMHMWMNQAAMKEMGGNYDSAVAIYLKVIDYFERKKDTVQLANGYNNLAILYEEIEQPDKAIHYGKKALSLRRIIKDTLNVAYSYNNLGVVYTELKKIPIPHSFSIKKLPKFIKC